MIGGRAKSILDLVEQDALRARLGLAALKPPDRALGHTKPDGKGVLAFAEGAPEPEGSGFGHHVPQ